MGPVAASLQRLGDRVVQRQNQDEDDGKQHHQRLPVPLHKRLVLVRYAHGFSSSRQTR